MNKLTCKKCGHEWAQRTDKRPAACPRCKSYYWDVEPKEKENERG